MHAAPAAPATPMTALRREHRCRAAGARCPSVVPNSHATRQLSPMTRRALVAVLLSFVVGKAARAQDTLPASRPVNADTVRATVGGWNDASTLALVRRATERRAV